MVGGCLAFVAFAAAVGRLGAGRAALFAALVPSSAVLLAIPLTGQWPAPLQWGGVMLASAGLIISLDLWAGRRTPLPQAQGGTSSGD